MVISERHRNALSQKTGIGIIIYDRLPENIDPRIYGLIESKRVSGWYDQEKDSVCLFSRNIPTEESSFDSTVAFLYVREKGIAGLLGTHLEAFCEDIANDIYHGHTYTRTEQADVTFGYINDLRPTDLGSWQKISERIGHYTGFSPDYKFCKAIISGHQCHQKSLYYLARKNGDLDAVNEFVTKRLLDRNNQAGASLGHAGDAYLRVGYPDSEIQIRNPKVCRFLSENELLDSPLCNLTRLIHDPVAIIANRTSGKECQEPMNIILTDYYVKGMGYLSFAIDGCNSILAGYGTENPNISVRSARFMSEYAILSALGSENGGSIRYLRPGARSGYAVSEMLDRMHGRSFTELGKKIGDGSTQVLTPLSESRHLTHVTNIVNNFRNPISAEKRKEFFGSYLYEDNIERRRQVRREITQTVAMAGYKVTRTSKTKAPNQIFFSEKDFSAALVKKMNNAKVYSAFDIMTYGKERFGTDFGPRAFKKAVEFLDSHNLSFLNHTVIKRISESDAVSLDYDGQQSLIRRDMYNAMSVLDSSMFSKEILMPRKVDGSYFRGAESYVMMAKSLSLARWRDCNVFISRSEAESMEIGIRNGAVPTFVRERGRLEPYYNLSETSFASDQSGLFTQLKECSKDTSIPVGHYAKAYLYGLSGGSGRKEDLSVYNIDLMDSAFERYFQKGNSLVSTSGFTEMISPLSQNTSMKENRTQKEASVREDQVHSVNGIARPRGKGFHL